MLNIKGITETVDSKTGIIKLYNQNTGHQTEIDEKNGVIKEYDEENNEVAIYNDEVLHYYQQRNARLKDRGGELIKKAINNLINKEKNEVLKYENDRLDSDFEIKLQNRYNEINRRFDNDKKNTLLLEKKKEDKFLNIFNNDQEIEDDFLSDF